MKNKFDAILPCRMTSTRLYGKPLQYIDIKNKITIIEYLVNYLKTSKYLDKVIIAIADSKGNDILAEYAMKNNWEFIFGDEIDMLGRMIKAADQYGSNTIIQGSTESPFMYYNNIDEVFKMHIENDFDFSKTDYLPDGAGYAFFKTDALRVSHKKGNSRHRSELVSSYIFDNPNEFKINSVSPNKKLKRSDIRITVDYPEDLVFCRKIYTNLNGEKDLVEMSDIIDYWDNNCNLRKDVEEIGVDWGHGRLWD